MKEGLFSQVVSDRMGGNYLKMMFYVDIRKKNTGRVVRYWKRLPREVKNHQPWRDLKNT